MVLFDLLACPWDQSALERGNAELICPSCHRRYPVEDGIPVFITQSDQWDRSVRGTELFETLPEYFERLHLKRLREWGTIPYLSETFTRADSVSLDVGSGAGTLSLINAKRGIDSVAMDISIHGARYGLSQARKLGLSDRCFFVVGDAVRLPFRSDCFQLVTNYTAIEHVYDPARCLEEMHRVTKPGGNVLVNTINNFSIRREKGWWNAWGDFFSELTGFFSFLRNPNQAVSPQCAAPSAVTRDKWKTGEELDLYHARSYHLLEMVKRLFTVTLYTSHSYPDKTAYLLHEDLHIEQRPLPGSKILFYRTLKVLERLPLLRHIGTTITIIGRKRVLNH